MSESRHNPDQLLKEIQADEENRNKGHLKIFFGYAAGVGKTYAMLEAAHMEKQQGIDVVAGTSQNSSSFKWLRSSSYKKSFL